jgi:hypothetical protein
MALVPVNDSLKVLVKGDDYGYGNGDSGGVETGVVVQVPDMMIYLAFHSFAFEQSIANDEILGKVQQYYNQFLNKKIYWESLNDRGRKIKEGDKIYVYLKMTDIIAYSDDLEDEAYVVDQVGKSGSFNL